MAKGPWTNISRGQLDNAFLSDKGTYFSPRNSSEVNLSHTYTHTRAPICLYKSVPGRSVSNNEKQ